MRCYYAVIVRGAQLMRRVPVGFLVRGARIVRCLPVGITWGAFVLYLGGHDRWGTQLERCSLGGVLLIGFKVQCWLLRQLYLDFDRNFSVGIASGHE